MTRHRIIHYYTPDGAHPPRTIVQEVKSGRLLPERTRPLTTRSALRLCRLLERLANQPGIQVGVTAHFNGWSASVDTR